MSVLIDFDACENTGVCAMICPEDVLEHENGTTRIVDPRACTDCWLCVDGCVSGAITVD